MKDHPSGQVFGEFDDAIMAAASDWVVRHDLGLTPEEEREFDRWLREDSRHTLAWERLSGVWGILVRKEPGMIQEPQPVVPASRRWQGWGVPLAAAAAIALGLAAWWSTRVPASLPPARIAAVATEPRMVVLSDGTAVYLKAGSEIAERYSQDERRVLLLQGEAHFEVAKIEAWPFVVRAGLVEVRAVGTAFNVDMQSKSVEVRVTEGRVRVASSQQPTAVPGATGPQADAPLVIAGQRAVVESSPDAPAVIRISQMAPDELAQTGAWLESRVRLEGGKTLAQLAEEFSLRTGRTLTLADPEIRNIKVGGHVRADDLDGFVWMMQSYGLRAERSPDGGFILRKSP